MNITAWLLFGAIIGLVSFFLDKKPNGSMLGAVVLGALGALVGGIFANAAFGLSDLSGFSVITFSLVALGSLLLVVSSKALRGISKA